MKSKIWYNDVQIKQSVLGCRVSKLGSPYPDESLPPSNFSTEDATNQLLPCFLERKASPCIGGKGAYFLSFHTGRAARSPLVGLFTVHEGQYSDLKKLGYGPSAGAPPNAFYEGASEAHMGRSSSLGGKRNTRLRLR